MEANHTVLLVDDNATFLHHATRFLERVPWLRVGGTARRIADGLAAAERLYPDVILLDLSIPEGSSLEAISDFQGAVPEACIIVLTMQDAEVYRDAALQHGAHAFVSKSRMVFDLVDAILCGLASR